MHFHLYWNSVLLVRVHSAELDSAKIFSQRPVFENRGLEMAHGCGEPPAGRVR
eukprot:COSAG02_NODE_4839_length_4919_cov_149.355187_2_plen_53_part_00